MRLTVEEAHAQCVAAGTTLNCTGSFPTGINETGGFNTVNVNALTSDIQGSGALFANTIGSDLTFNADSTPFQIMLNPTFSRTVRAGFGARTDGAVFGTITGDITGPTVADSNTTNLFDLNNFGSFNFLTGTGVNLTHNGLIDVSRPTISATTQSQANPFAPGGLRDFVMGTFGAVRIRDDSGDILFMNNGDVRLDGGQRNLNVDRSGDTGINQRVFSTRFSSSPGQSNDSNHIGLLLEANGDLDISQTGDIILTGGGVDVSSTTTAAVASTIARHSGGRGVFITDNDFGAVDQVSFADPIDLTINGDVSLTSGQVSSVAIANNPGGNANTKAIAQTGLSSQIGIWINKPGERNVTVNGDIRVLNDMTTVSAQAINGSGAADGLAAISSFGNSASGFESSSFLVSDTSTRKLSVNIAGDVVVQGGGINADIVATGTSSINDLSSLNIFTPDEALRVNRFGGSSATGLSLFSEELGYEIGGSVTVTGGDAQGTMTGSSMKGIVNGGRATGLSASTIFGVNGVTFNKTEDSAFTATGGNALLTTDGTDLEGTVTGGFGSAVSLTLAATGMSRFVQTGDIDANGGSATGVASVGSKTDAQGGFAQGLFLQASPVFSVSTIPAGTATLRNEAKITVTGGDAVVTGSGEAIGGTAIGFRAVPASEQETTRVEHSGSIVATGGMGATRQGIALGLFASDFGFSNIDSSGNEVANAVDVFVDGTINVSGEGTSEFVEAIISPSGGIVTGVTGMATTTLSGGSVTVQGDLSHGIISAAQKSEITVENGAIVRVSGIGGAGIALGLDRDIFITGISQPSNNTITLEAGTSVTSANGVGIFDDGRTGSTTRVGNNTVVNLAGILMGGNGIAIDFGAGQDRLTMSNTATVGGSIDKSGDGVLRINGGFQNALELNANGGTSFLETAMPGLAAQIGTNGAFVSQTEVASLNNKGNLAVGTALKGDAGTLIVNGNFINSATGTYTVDIDSADNSDLLDVTGSADLDGSLSVNAIGMGFDTSNMYTIIDADGGVSGTFSSVFDNLPDLDAEAVYEANLVKLGLVAATAGSSNTSDKSIYPNSLQASVEVGQSYANLLHGRMLGNGSGSGLSTSTNFALAYDSGFEIGDLENGGQQAIAPSLDNTTGTFVWMAGFGSFRNVDNSSLAIGYDANIGGVAFGLEKIAYHNEALVTAGISGGYSTTDVRGGMSSADIHSWHLGIYGKAEQNDWGLSGILTYGFQDYDMTRVIPVPPAFVTAFGNANGGVFAGSLELSRNMVNSVGLNNRLSGFSPFARIEHVNANRDGFSETGAGVINLTFGHESFNRTFTTVGLQMAAEHTSKSGAKFSSFLNVGWEHAFNERQAVNASIIPGIAGAGFTSVGAAEDRDRLVVGFGVDMDLAKNLTASFNYDGRYGTGVHDHRGNAVFALKF